MITQKLCKATLMTAVFGLMAPFSHSIWADQAFSNEVKITASDGAAEDRFGVSVSLFENTAIVGALGDDDNGSFSGSAYIFKNQSGTWTEVMKLLPSDGAEEDFFRKLCFIVWKYCYCGGAWG